MSLFTMLGETTRSLFKAPVTERYPFTPKTYPPGSRGHIAIEVTKCTLCVVCDKRCPTQAIVVDRVAKTWTIDRLRCIQCGFCAEVCPKKCLTLPEGYTPVTSTKGHDRFDIPYTPPVKKPVEPAKEAT